MFASTENDILKIVGLPVTFEAGKKIDSIASNIASRLALFKINKVLVQPTITKDICLFEGTLESKIDDYIKLRPLLPIITESEMEEDSHQEATIYHYPIGLPEQRKNVGTARGNGKHSIRSLAGSSGAAIFRNLNEIIGIHSGAMAAKLAVVHMDAIGQSNAGVRKIHELPVVEENIFTKFTIQDYNEILEAQRSYDDVPTREFKDIVRAN